MHRSLPIISAIALQASPMLAAPALGGHPGDAQALSSTSSGLDAAAPGARADEASQLFVAARERYRAGDLAGAVDALTKCHELTQDSNLLFNIGQVYREKEDCAAAADYYRRYLAEAPTGERVADARRFLADPGPKCQAQTPQTEASKPPSVAGPSITAQPDPPVPFGTIRPASPPGTVWTTVGWVSIGVAAVATGMSLGLIPTTVSDYDDAKRMQDGRMPYSRSHFSDYARHRNWLIATGTTAGVTAAFGVIALTVLAPRARQTLTPSVALVDGGGVIGVGGSL